MECRTELEDLVTGAQAGNLRAFDALVYCFQGYAVRYAASLLGKATTIDAGFPTTTAAALTTLTTGTTPGVHGMVGYRVRDAAGRLTNQLSGWDDRMDPATWQRSRTVFERAVEQGVRARAIGLPKFAGSGFTEAVLRGAEFVGVQSLAER